MSTLPNGSLFKQPLVCYGNQQLQPRAATCTPPRTATPSLGAREFKPVQFYTQNCRGLKTDSSLTELIHVAQWRDAFASCLQETSWRPQDHEKLCDLEGGHTFIGVGQALNSAGRGSQGWVSSSHLVPPAHGTWRRRGTDAHIL